jgi:hypothetical protein
LDATYIPIAMPEINPIGAAKTENTGIRFNVVATIRPEMTASTAAGIISIRLKDNFSPATKDQAIFSEFPWIETFCAAAEVTARWSVRVTTP